LIEEETKEEFKEPLPRNNNAATNNDRSFLDTMITSRIYNFSFGQEMAERMNFLKTLIVMCPEYLLEPETLKSLWELQVTNAF
jgi:hypothetical protein